MRIVRARPAIGAGGSSARLSTPARAPERSAAGSCCSQPSQARSARRSGGTRTRPHLLARQRAAACQCARLRLGALAGQAQHRALADQRLQRRGAELRPAFSTSASMRSLDRNADRQRDGDRQLRARPRGRRGDAQRRPRCARCGRSRPAIRRRRSPLNRRERRRRAAVAAPDVARLAGGRTRLSPALQRPARWMRTDHQRIAFRTRASHAGAAPAPLRHGAERRTRSPIRALVSRHQCSAAREPGEGHEPGLDQHEEPADAGGAEHLGGDDDDDAEPGAGLRWINQSATQLERERAAPPARERAAGRRSASSRRTRASSRCRCSHRASTAAMAVSGRQPHSMRMTIAARTSAEAAQDPPQRESAIFTEKRRALTAAAASSAAVERPTRLGGDASRPCARGSARSRAAPPRAAPRWSRPCRPRGSA